MNRLHVVVWVAVCALLVTAAARADIPPPDSCSAAGVGAACMNAKGPTGAYDAAGICADSTCTRYGPLPEGGMGTTQSPCVLCVAGDAGSSSGSSGSSGADASTGSTSSGSSGGGSCAVGAIKAQAIGPLALIAAGAILVAASRRRRARR